MSTRPVTPKLEDIVFRERWRFLPNTAYCEGAELYAPGGYHPVNLGDSFRNGAYTVIRKLGYGSFSTVWLAVDTKTRYESSMLPHCHKS